MKIIEIARQLGLSRQTVSRVENGHRHTENIGLAMALGRKNKRKPISYIRKDMRSLYLAAHPEMGER